MNVKLFGTKELAEKLGVSHQTIRNRIADRKLRAQRVSGRWVVILSPEHYEEELFRAKLIDELPHRS